MPNIFRMLDLSTDHLPQDVRDDLNGFDGVIANPRKYGWLLLVPEDIDKQVSGYRDLPESVVGIWRYAQEHDCQYVLLDVDADRDPDLPYWES